MRIAVLQFVLGIIRERCDRDHSRAKGLGTTLSGELSKPVSLIQGANSEEGGDERC